MCRRCERFSENVRRITSPVNVLKLDTTLLDFIPNMMDRYIDVFGLCYEYFLFF